MTTQSTELLVRHEGDITIMTLNRPERMNALGSAIVSQLHTAIEELVQAGIARALIITGAGERAFCSGVDLKERAGMSDAERWLNNRALNACANLMSGAPIPTIAAINGLALGGGCELSLACDLRVAASTAFFGLPEVGLGIIPGAGGTQRLPRLIGPMRAKEMIFTGRRISAETALAWGLVSQVTPPEQLLPVALELAQQIARQSPFAVAHAKAAIDSGLDTTLDQGLYHEAAAIRTTLASADYQIGLAAFAAKDSPIFPPIGTRQIV
jgi:enoyl-CoA hydratase/carnithine racemase